MLVEVEVPVSAAQQKHTETLKQALEDAVKGRAELSRNPLLFAIGSWQTGDFGHVYAAIVSNMMSVTPRAVGLIILRSGGGMTGLLNDIRFALKDLCERRKVKVVVMYTADLKKENAIKILSKAGNPKEPLVLHYADVHDPYEATFMAKDIVLAMQPGQPMTPVWAELARGGASDQSKAYALAVEQFTKEYLEKFTASDGREKFVCVWSRTSGMRMEGRPTGGANPQYDSSEESNHQLCTAIKARIPELKCIFIVGPDGFAAKTKSLPYVFDLGAFWKKLAGVMGRFQENGFFDFMTAVYDCDVVHVGMKSGGMDVLGLWGQKVVFVDTIKSPEPTAARVGAWNNADLLVPVPVDQLPTKTGKAIDAIREDDKEKGNTKTIRTSVSANQWAQVDARTDALADGFTKEGLQQVVDAVAKLLSA